MIKEADELLCLGSEDKVISVVRYYNWDLTKINDEWFENMEKEELKAGIKFDEELPQKFPDIGQSLKDQNEGCCKICFLDFEEEDEEYRAESLECGHQYNVLCWKQYLKDKV